MNGKHQKDNVKCCPKLHNRIVLSVGRRANAGLDSNLEGFMKSSILTSNDSIILFLSISGPKDAVVQHVCCEIPGVSFTWVMKMYGM